jgi:hypothetical protein
MSLSKPSYTPSEPVLLAPIIDLQHDVLPTSAKKSRTSFHDKENQQRLLEALDIYDQWKASNVKKSLRFLWVKKNGGVPYEFHVKEILQSSSEFLQELFIPGLRRKNGTNLVLETLQNSPRVLKMKSSRG